MVNNMARIRGASYLIPILRRGDGGRLVYCIFRPIPAICSDASSRNLIFFFLSLPSRYLLSASFDDSQLRPSLCASIFPLRARRLRYLSVNFESFASLASEIKCSLFFSAGVSTLR